MSLLGKQNSKTKNINEELNLIVDEPVNIENIPRFILGLLIFIFLTFFIGILLVIIFLPSLLLSLAFWTFISIFIFIYILLLFFTFVWFLFRKEPDTKNTNLTDYSLDQITAVESKVNLDENSDFSKNSKNS